MDFRKLVEVQRVSQLPTAHMGSPPPRPTQTPNPVPRRSNSSARLTEEVRSERRHRPPGMLELSRTDLQGSANPWAPGCENALGKLRQK